MVIYHPKRADNLTILFLGFSTSEVSVRFLHGLQGEDKPSPLLWTKWLGRLLRSHSKGDGLSSPCC